MSKKLFGNLVTYKGKYLSTAKAKASNGNLVFAQITGSPTDSADPKATVDGVDNLDKDGYYIWAGGAEGHLVDLDTFKALKNEVAGLATKLGTFDEADVPAYVEARLAELGDAAKKGVATTIGAKDVATDDNLATEKAVRDAIDAVSAVAGNALTGVSVNGTLVEVEDNVAKLTADTTVTKDSANLVTSGAVEKAIEDAVGTIGNVMNFIGVVSEVPVDANVSLSDGTTAVAEKGDVITVTDGSEYVWDGAAWREIGKVGVEEAVTSIGDVKGDITLGPGLSMDGQQLTVTFPEIPEVTAESIAYSNESHITEEGVDEPEITNIKQALDEIFNDERVIAASLVDINDRLDGAHQHTHTANQISYTSNDNTTVESALDDLYTKVDEAAGEAAKTVAVEGDSATWSEVTPTTEENVTTYTVKNKLADDVDLSSVTDHNGEAVTPATASGLATDGYVKDYVASALAWEVLVDEE